MQKVDLERFYECETLGVQAPDCDCPAKAISQTDRSVMKMFEDSCRKEGDRYVIGLPWKRDPSQLPDNYPLAEKRLYCLERSLERNKEKAQMYTAAVKEYMDQGWATPLTKEDLLDSKPAFYLPHHAVYRPEKKSTPLRVVFDPACQYRGISLNSFLHKGPCLIGNLLGVLLRFREQEVAFTGDISKMFLQICIPESDSHVHRFLWRDLDTSRDPTIYRLLRVAFGDKPSPDMASFVMLRIAEEHRSDFPDASEILERDRYVDDLIHSYSTKEEAVNKMKDLDHVLATGSFKIKKWYCSADVQEDVNGPAKKVIKSTIKSKKDTCDLIKLDKEEVVKALGVVWDSDSDMIGFSVQDAEIGKLTKRIVLSRVSGIYDPLGLASPVTIKARIALQDIWRSKTFDWDDKLPDKVSELWAYLFKDLRDLQKVEFPRSLKPPDSVGSSQLHVFADASMFAYGAVAFILWRTASSVDIRLVSAKARVAPLKQTTIPRLELMAALVASRLAKTIIDEFKENPAKVILWSDSQIVLHWLKTESIALKAFVGIRVAEIQSTWEPQQWRYVPTQLNPADDLSRGIKAGEMNTWMQGPAFLRLPEEEWPTNIASSETDDNSETKKPKLVSTMVPMDPLIKSCSSWLKLIRVTAYCMRFVFNTRVERTKQLSGVLQPEELEKAETYWYKEAQHGLGDWESRYRDLSPFIQNGIVRVGGRLRRLALDYDQVHPVLLPASHHVSMLIMGDVHAKMGHTGPERTLGEARRKVWVVRGRNMARSIVKDCVVCRKLRQKPHSTLMADLPPDRMNLFSPPFSVTGVDLFGPFLLKYGRNKSKKAWGAIFTCATVRAIHLEIVDGLSTQAFLHALRRFAAHHGWPMTIISDNGTSFVGTQKELKKLVMEGKRQISEFASRHKITWKFITPLSPHQGGLYESLIKQTKRAIQVAIGQQTLTWNEMTTVFAEAECLLNSRPIGYSPNHPDDFRPLTPNHFLLGRASVDTPQGPFEETKNLHKRFEFVQSLVQQFWKRFLREFVPTLIKRNKWQKKGRQIQIGDIVLLVDPFASRGKWDMGRVIEIYPGKGGIVRNVKVKTKNGEYKRSIQKCCVILEQPE